MSGRCEPGVCLSETSATGAAARGAAGSATASVTDVRQRLAAVKRAPQIDDINEIENLQGSYGYYASKMLWDEVVDLFTDDGTVEIGRRQRLCRQGRHSRYLLSLSGGEQGPLEGVLNDHFQLSRSCSRRRRPDGQRPVAAVSDDRRLGQSWLGRQLGEGVCENEYVQENGVWKIRALRWFAGFVAPYEERLSRTPTRKRSRATRWGAA